MTTNYASRASSEFVGEDSAFGFNLNEFVVTGQSIIKKTNVQPEDVIPSNVNERYDNEYEFFQKLKNFK